MKYGYVRAGNNDPLAIAAQTEKLKSFGVDEVVVETGEVLDWLIEKLQDGDELHVTNLDRLGRDTFQFIEKNRKIVGKGATLCVNGNSPKFLMETLRELVEDVRKEYPVEESEETFDLELTEDEFNVLYKVLEKRKASQRAEDAEMCSRLLAKLT